LAFTATNSVDSTCEFALSVPRRQIPEIPTSKPALHLSSPESPPIPTSKSVLSPSRDKYRRFPAQNRFLPFTPPNAVNLHPRSRLCFSRGQIRSMPRPDPCFSHFRRQMPLMRSRNEKEGQGNRAWICLR
jgi:hypothetical protein